MSMQLFMGVATAIYAIVGGPSVGKTSIIQELQDSGEFTMREASTDYILEQQEKGVKEPWNEDTFQLEVLKLHLMREEAVKQGLQETRKSRLFTDRGLLDHQIYSVFRKKTGTPSYREIQEILGPMNLKQYYKAVFYVHPYNGSNFVPDKTAARHEDLDEANQIIQLTYQIYSEGTDTMIEVPAYMTPKERAQFILAKVRELEAE